MKKRVMPIFALGIISTIFSGCVTENEVVNEKERTEIETESDVWSQGAALHLYQEGVILSDFSLGEVEKDNEWYPTIYTDDIRIVMYTDSILVEEKKSGKQYDFALAIICLLYTSPSPRD